MDRDYDQTIQEHYHQMALEHGLSSASTMEDIQTRDLETHSIMTFVNESLLSFGTETSGRQAILMDVGCGNGFTLDTVLRTYPTMQLVGIELSPDLRALASSRFIANDNIQILKGDVRQPDFCGNRKADIIICQRVLINLLNYEDQRTALHNLIDSLASPTNGKAGGTILFIESFSSSLQHLNDARAEFDLPPILPAHHNLYLPDQFFDSPRLTRFTDGFLPPENFLSTHYFVSRVLHEIFTRDKPFKRNSEFVKFFSQALCQYVGDYSPLKLFMFRKVE